MEHEYNEKIEMLKGGIVSFAANLGYLIIAAGDQRILLVIFLSIIAGGVLLFTPRGGIGFGILLGAVAAVIVALSLAGFDGLSPIRGH
ncbi:MAG: hypothetical protein JWP74_3049 [Marmoricola sp.]|nr:hypothetical protein [Marmoricola sp.]